VREQRRKIWIDPFQTYLAVRLAVYFVLYQAALWALFIIDARMNSLNGSVGAASAVFGFVLTPIAAITLGFLFVYDSIRLSHRIVGPVYRFRKTVQAVTAGEEVSTIVLREGDLLLDLRDDLNAMLRVLEQRGAITLRQPAPRPAAAKPATPEPAAV
jgi:hypothetical protein